MGFFESIFPNKNKKMLRELIEHNAGMIQRQERRTRHDAEYLAICLVLDDLANRPNGEKGRKAVMGLLNKEYAQHQNDVVTYVALNSGLIKLTPEAEKDFMKRHQKQ